MAPNLQNDSVSEYLHACNILINYNNGFTSETIRKAEHPTTVSEGEKD